MSTPCPRPLFDVCRYAIESLYGVCNGLLTGLAALMATARLARIVGLPWKLQSECLELGR